MPPEYLLANGLFETHDRGIEDSKEIMQVRTYVLKKTLSKSRHIL